MCGRLKPYVTWPSDMPYHQLSSQSIRQCVLFLLQRLFRCHCKCWAHKTVSSLVFHDTNCMPYSRRTGRCCMRSRHYQAILSLSLCLQGLFEPYHDLPLLAGAESGGCAPTSSRGRIRWLAVRGCIDPYRRSSLLFPDTLSKLVEPICTDHAHGKKVERGSEAPSWEVSL